MEIELSKFRRKSQMDMGKIYFWTATINKWYRLLFSDQYKQVITDSLAYLTTLSKIDVFAFVIMPTHIHFIWGMLDYNGIETPQGSFLKFTAHQFMKMLREENTSRLLPYQVNAANRRHEFWQRDPLAIPLYTRKVAFQKLNYIHRNPVAKGRKLVPDLRDYQYSSARYYEREVSNLRERDLTFPFLRDLRLEF